MTPTQSDDQAPGFPRASDEAAAARFLADLREREAATGLLLPDGALPLLRAIGGNSPYLSDLARREFDVLCAILSRGPDPVCDDALLQLSRQPGAAQRAAVADAMRRAKRHVALASALADIGGVWSLEQVTGALSDLADAALRVATAHLLHVAHARGEITLPHPQSPDRGSGFAVLAMGKLGAHELNYSSDVDLILLYDPACHPGREDRLGQCFTRMARDLSGLMEARDAGGYVFRVDLRLRPDPASTPPAIALPGALAYYEGQGQTWERAAMIKARPVAGDLALGRRFLQAIRPFIWRRHLDFAALADITAMKRRIDAHKGTRSGILPGHDLKLGKGGIREIEFCAQALQLVWGGRTPALRTNGTLATLRAAMAEGHLPAADVAVLERAYRFLRRAEHRLQMVGDRQTHALPGDQAGLDAMAAFLGYGDAQEFGRDLLAQAGAVHAIFSGLLETPALPPDEPAPDPAGIAAPDPARSAILEGWMSGRPRALRTERSRVLLHEMLPAITAAIGRQPDPQAALARLDEFIYRLPAGVQVLSMLRHNPALLDRLADVMGAAPFLSDYLSGAPAALEGLAAPRLIEARPDAALAARLRDAAGLDDAMAIASRFVRAGEFAIAVAELFGSTGVDAAGCARTAQADAVLRALLGHALQDHASRYGIVPGGGLAVVALGKAGSGEMMAGSDLDLMLIYDHPEESETSVGGPRALPASQYYARAAQAVIAALTVPTRHRPLYAVDMRLRPSGKAGPVAVSLASFNRYHAGSAWTWELLALTRSRVVAGPSRLRRSVREAITAALQGAERGRILPDTADMRRRLAREYPGANPWDIKHRPGGLMELEFIAQSLCLLHGLAAPPRWRPAGTAPRFQALADAGVLDQADAARLERAARLWRTVQSLLRITVGPAIPVRPPLPAIERILAATALGRDEAGLLAGLDAIAQEVRDAFTRHVGDIAE